MNFDWIHTNTFHHSAFADLQALVAAKELAGLSISLCIPTLNEELTIGREISVFKRELIDRCRLVDEIVVIDSGSTDRTAAIARKAGADVHFSGAILPNHGYRLGKGENLWKAVYQLKGDIICYVDADISNIHPRFVYGLVAPLIYHPQLQYVKACYERPMASATGVRGTGGGRVTEILVRPLFSLFYPELTQLLQPLSGEYAVRRGVLESIPFPIGYGVETSHLLDVYQLHGMAAFAQTDLDQRVHRNQSTGALGLMSFGIMQSFLSRLPAHGKLQGVDAVSNIYRAWRLNGTGHKEIVEEFADEERPPMASIPEYRQRFPPGA